MGVKKEWEQNLTLCVCVVRAGCGALAENQREFETLTEAKAVWCGGERESKVVEKRKEETKGRDDGREEREDEMERGI